MKGTIARRSLTVLGAAMAAALLLLLGTRAFALVPFQGDADVNTKARTEITGTVKAGTGFVTLSGSQMTFVVPPGESRLFDARFSAESLCTGTGENWCIVRIVATDSSTVRELHPNASGSFAFDSAGSDLWESHAMERLIRLPAGTFIFTVEVRTTSPTTSFTVDDWVFVVDRRV